MRGGRWSGGGLGGGIIKAKVERQKNDWSGTFKIFC